MSCMVLHAGCISPQAFVHSMHGGTTGQNSTYCCWWPSQGNRTKVDVILDVLVATAGRDHQDWVLWAEQNALVLNPAFTFPYERYDAAGRAIIMYGNPEMTAAGHVNGEARQSRADAANPLCDADVMAEACYQVTGTMPSCVRSDSLRKDT